MLHRPAARVDGARDDGRLGAAGADPALSPVDTCAKFDDGWGLVVSPSSRQSRPAAVRSSSQMRASIRGPRPCRGNQKRNRASRSGKGGSDPLILLASSNRRFLWSIPPLSTTRTRISAHCFAIAQIFAAIIWPAS
jgi:hypothetical protein